MRDAGVPARPAGQADLVEGILLGLAGEWRSAYQDYQADEALQLVAWLQIAARRYSRYIGAARLLGANHWMPIVALAESAAAAGRTELAIEIFRAADQPGMHCDLLRERCLKLTGMRLDDPASTLRVVK